MGEQSNQLAHTPHFIGVGAPRAGTTWLYEMLRRAPGVWMPPIKELHYFDSIDPRISEERFTHSQSYRFRQFSLWRAKHYVAKAAPFVDTKAPQNDPNRVKTDVDWDKRFFGPGGDLKWYAGLFERKASEGFVTGEITPDYSVLCEETIDKVKELNPDLKILFMLRDPIERTWSNAVFWVTRKTGRKVSDLTDQEWIEACERAPCMERSDYLAMLDKWRARFPEEQIFIGYYDEVGADPQALLERTLGFLGAPFVPEAFEGLLERRVNAAAADHKRSAPAAVAQHLARKFLSPLHELETRLGAPAVAKWREKAEELI